jgi:hypothetical protein
VHEPGCQTRQSDPSLAWEDLSAEDRRALTEMLVDKTVIAPHPHKIDKDGRRHYLIRTRSTKTAGATISSAASRTKIPSGRPNGSRWCMRRGSRSSPESEQRRRDSTLDIADYLKISVHTVQSHLRNIFTKPEYAPRCDLVTKIFFAHYEPRLRDNEQRTAANLPLRGGPAGAHSPHRRPGRAQAEPATK